MNWYKRIILAQQTIDKPHYLDIGHAKLNEDENILNNYLWIYYNGILAVRPETEKEPTHGDAFGYIFNDEDFSFNRIYQGRYESSTGKLSIVIPLKGLGAFRSVPSRLINKLYQKFPDITQIYTY